MNKLRTTNILLLILVIPVVFYLIKELKFIFIPLVSSMFIALLFLPLMRWFNRNKWPKFLSISVVLIFIVAFFKIIGELIKLSSRQILAKDGQYLELIQKKLSNVIGQIERFLGIDVFNQSQAYDLLAQKEHLVDNFGSVFNFLGNTLSTTLMILFFVVLWLAESINFEKLMNNTLLKQKFASVRTFRKIEKDLIKFIKVKFAVSLFTGIGIGLACHFFDVSFPIFWGLFAFIINFVQMIGSFISVILLALFAFVEIDLLSTWFFFTLSITGVQILFGGVLEPIFMGKSFSINIITILVMLMFWGYLWGIPGMIMAIPITVFIKIILEQYPNTRTIANLLSGDQSKGF